MWNEKTPAEWLKDWPLRRRQAAFAYYLGKMLRSYGEDEAWYDEQGVRHRIDLRLGEGHVADTIAHADRQLDHWIDETNTAGYTPILNSLHLEGGAHYNRLGQDLILDVDGTWIQGDHPVWHEMGRYWKLQHPLARWGGDFEGRSAGDFGHFSFLVRILPDGREVK